MRTDLDNLRLRHDQRAPSQWVVQRRHLDPKTGKLGGWKSVSYHLRAHQALRWVLETQLGDQEDVVTLGGVPADLDRRLREVSEDLGRWVEGQSSRLLESLTSEDPARGV